MEKICNALGIPLVSLCIESLRAGLETVYLGQEVPEEVLDSMETAVLSIERQWSETYQ